MYPTHDIVDIGWRGEVDVLSILVDPGVVELRASGHGRARVGGATLGDNTVELVQVCVEVKYIDSDPFHDVDVFREDDDGLEVAFDQGGLYEGAA